MNLCVFICDPCWLSKYPNAPNWGGGDAESVLDLSVRSISYDPGSGGLTLHHVPVE